MEQDCCVLSFVKWANEFCQTRKMLELNLMWPTNEKDSFVDKALVYTEKEVWRDSDSVVWSGDIL